MRRLQSHPPCELWRPKAAGLGDALAAALRDELGTAFAAAVDLIRAAQGRVIVTGMGKSGHVARKIASTLASTGTPAFFVHPSEASHGDLGMIANNDVIFGSLMVRRNGRAENIADYSRRHAIKLIAMTAISESTLAKVADVVLSLPQAREACPHNLAPTSSLVQLALGHALAIALLESHGFTAVDFGLLHPGGKLGTLLKAVRDLMHSGATMPLSPFGTRMSEAILRDDRQGFRLRRRHRCTRASGRLSPTAICGRRMRDKFPARRPSRGCDDAGSETVRPDQLFSETLDILNVMKVTALFAVEAGKPVGVIHVHELFRAGTA